MIVAARESGSGVRRDDGQLICPTGNFTRSLSSPRAKNISLFHSVETAIEQDYPVSTKGRFAIVTDVRRGAVDADGALTKALEADGEVVWS